MNKEMISRLREAKKHQKMAIKALLPEQEQKHLDIIEHELKAMMMEMVFEAVKDCQESNMKNETDFECKSDSKPKGAKKVNIE